MSNEKKLKQLINIAIDNGWEDTTRDCNILLPDKITLWNGDTENNMFLSINDVVTNFDEIETPFIETLCMSVDVKNFYLLYNNCQTFNKDLCDTIRINWVLQPVDERLEWLFETFNHLL